MKIILFILFSLIGANLLAQNPFVGKWKCYHRELINGRTLDYEGNPYSCNDLIIELNPNFSGIESKLDLTFSYEFNDSLLRMGNRIYFIELIDSEELVISEYNPDGLTIGYFRQKFKKINKSAPK